MYGLAQLTRNNAFMHDAGKNCLPSSTKMYWNPGENDFSGPVASLRTNEEIRLS